MGELQTIWTTSQRVASAWLDQWGGTSGTFNGLDQFNRIIDQRWQNAITGTPADIDRYKYGYDLNSNRQWKQNVVSSAASVPLDEYYDYDNLNRLTEMQRGTLTGGPPFTGIGGTPGAEQDWTLDPNGNWSGFVTKASGTTTLNQTRTQNPVNEITAIGGTPGWATPPAYDAAGNMNSFPQPASPTSAFTAVYDAWNRMVSVSSGGSTVATYQYDGRNFRIVKYTASTSETRHFYYTNNWQDIEERVGSTTTMDKQYVWGTRYVDDLACRDDGTPQRLYALQDANYNLTSVCNISGSVVERYLFDPYGARTIMNGSWGVLSASAYAWVVGHQGLMQDAESGLIYDRARYVGWPLGSFTVRDPRGYSDSLSLYEYCRSNPLSLVDPAGFGASGGPSHGCPPPPKCNGKPYQPGAQCCENGTVVDKVPVWICARPFQSYPYTWLIPGGLRIPGTSWILGHGYFCCGGENVDCYGDPGTYPAKGPSPGPPNTPIGGGMPLPTEFLPVGDCTSVYVCPSAKQKKCSNPTAVAPLSPNPLGHNCHDEACSGITLR